MKRRSTFFRILAVVWATLQLASPGLASIADGMLASASASAPSTHVEATTSASCPVVHSPDCALCRYLSAAASDQQPTLVVLALAAESAKPDAAICVPGSRALGLPHERGPPTV